MDIYAGYAVAKAVRCALGFALITFPTHDLLTPNATAIALTVIPLSCIVQTLARSRQSGVRPGIFLSRFARRSPATTRSEGRSGLALLGNASRFRTIHLDAFVRGSGIIR
jgi:hypothetical protein